VCVFRIGEQGISACLQYVGVDLVLVRACIQLWRLLTQECTGFKTPDGPTGACESVCVYVCV
jgi:hypothetical protein